MGKRQNKVMEKIRATNPAELATQLRDGAENMFRLRFQMSMGQTDGIKKIRVLRKERARILTQLRSQGESTEMAAPKAAPAKKGKK